MHAITVNEYGAAPALTDVPDPQAGPGQVLIKIEAAGMNPMDQTIANGATPTASRPSPHWYALASTALTRRYVADTEALASQGVTGVNIGVSMSSEAGAARGRGRQRPHRRPADYPRRPRRRTYAERPRRGEDRHHTMSTDGT
jgi:threonine dehydrogenase-like Zn-dependent dehydrogenase